MPRNPANDIDDVPSYLDDVPAYAAMGTPRSTEPLPIQYFDDIDMQLTNLWLVKHLLPAIGIAVLYGHPGSGKTFLALDWALHVALGWEWQGRKVKQGIVVYVGAEGLSGLRNRVEAFRRQHDARSVPFALIPCPIDMQAPDADVNRLIDAIRAIEEKLEGRVVMVVIDTLSKTFGAGKENTDDMVPYVANCQRVANEFECLTMPVHHRPKDAESEDPRGHSSLKGGAETVILVEAGETKRARVTKQKDGEDGVEMLFRLKVIELGVDEDGDPVTSCVVEATDVDLAPRGDTQAMKEARLPDGTKVALSQLDETLIQSGFYPPSDIPDAEINRMKVGKVVKLDDWRDKAMNSAGTYRDTDRDKEHQRRKKAFNRALDRLKKDDIVKIYGEFAWRRWEASSGSRGTSGTGRDIHRDTYQSRDGTNRDTQGSPYGGNPDVSRSMSRHVPPAESPPAWMDEAPPFDPEAWRGNPLLNGRDR